MKEIEKNAIKPAPFSAKSVGIAASLLLMAGLSLSSFDTFAQGRRGDREGGGNNGNGRSERSGGFERRSAERSNGGNDRVGMSRGGNDGGGFGNRGGETRGSRMGTPAESPRAEGRGSFPDRGSVGREDRGGISLNRPDRVQPQPDVRTDGGRIETQRPDNDRGGRWNDSNRNGGGAFGGRDNNNDSNRNGAGAFGGRDNDNDRNRTYAERGGRDNNYGDRNRWDNNSRGGRDNNYGNRGGWDNRGGRDNDRYDRRGYDDRRYRYDNNSRRYDGRYGSPSWRYYNLPRRNSVINILPSACMPVYYGGINYSYYNGIYYRPYGNTYRVAFPPVGLRINILPLDCQLYTFFGRQYNYYNGTYYRPIGNQYEVVPPPVGALVESIPDGYEQVIIDGETYYIVDGVQYKAVMYQGEIWYEVIKINYNSYDYNY